MVFDKYCIEITRQPSYFHCTVKTKDVGCSCNLILCCLLGIGNFIDLCSKQTNLRMKEYYLV